MGRDGLDSGRERRGEVPSRLPVGGMTRECTNVRLTRSRPPARAHPRAAPADDARDARLGRQVQPPPRSGSWHCSSGRIDDAIVELEALLDHNPNDNQGLRDPLLGDYLRAGRLEQARTLLLRYEDDSSAVWAWGRTLERFLYGDQLAAQRALGQARACNRHAEKYLAGTKRLPARQPETYSPGAESEAVVGGEFLGEAWAAQPEALARLRARAGL